jgi:hypothetical protein
MKKFLLFAVCFICSSIAFAQISADKVEEDGSRWILTENSNLYTGWTNAAAFNLSYTLKVNGEETYEITLCLNEGKMQFEEGRKLLIKFKDGSMMELKNNRKIGPADYKYNVTSTGTDYFTFPQYSITEEEIQKIIDGEAIKIRIENDVEFFDRTIKKNKFSKGMKKAYEAIKAKKGTKNDVYEGF